MKTFFTLVSILLLSSSTLFAQQVNKSPVPQKSLFLKLIWNYDDFTDSGIGTGFLIQPNDSLYLVTCMHVILQRKGADTLDINELINGRVANNLYIYLFNGITKGPTSGLYVDDLSNSIKIMEDDISKKIVDLVLIPIKYDPNLEDYIVDCYVEKNDYNFDDITYCWGFPESNFELKEPKKVMSYLSVSKLITLNNEYYKASLGHFLPGMSGSPIYSWRSGKYNLIGVAKGGELSYSMHNGTGSYKGIMVDFIPVSKVLSGLP